jgi:hypothetical protein
MRSIHFYYVKGLLLISLFAAALGVQAQSNWEIGGRFGHNFSIDMTIPISAAPRLHPAVYFDNNVALGTYFDWLFSLDGGPTGLKFYPGIGPELYFGNNVGFAIAGDFGAEYSFKFPLTIGIDWRPHFMLTNDFKFGSNNWGIFARFRFGEGVNFVKSN